MDGGVRVGLAGATGALGKEILRFLGAASWRPARVVPLASARTEISHVEYGDERIAVDLLDEQALDELDLILLAVPAEVAREVGDRAAMEGVGVIDCSGAYAEDHDAVLSVPWINPEALAQGSLGVIVLPRPEALLLGSALGPLHRAGLVGRVSATVLVPASIAGRDGIDELSRQVTALFNQAPPPRKIFSHGLAFDLLPQMGPATEEGWTAAEAQVVEHLQRLVEAELEVSVTRVGVPIFSGISAEVRVELSRPAPLELIHQILVDGGVKLPEDEGERYIPRPRRVEGKPFAHAGRLRFDSSGALHLWLAMDNLATTAAAAVSAAGLWIRRA